MTSYINLADNHYRLAQILKIQEFCRGIFESHPKTKQKKFSEMIVGVFGSDVLQYHDVPMHFQLAQNNYYKGVEMHNEGSSYKKIISNMNFLEDDFNDNLYHFTAAIDRQKINNGVIRKKIQRTINELKKTKLLMPEAYVQ